MIRVASETLPSDRVQEAMLALRYCDSEREAHLLLIDVEHRAARIADQPGFRAAVRRVSAALIEQGELDGATVRQLIEGGAHGQD